MTLIIADHQPHVGSRKSEDRRQKSEARSQKAEARRQKPEVRKARTRNKKQETRNPSPPLSVATHKIYTEAIEAWTSTQLNVNELNRNLGRLQTALRSLRSLL